MMTERQNEHTFPARFDFALSVLALGIAVGIHCIRARTGGLLYLYEFSFFCDVV